MRNIVFQHKNSYELHKEILKAILASEEKKSNYLSSFTYQFTVTKQHWQITTDREKKRSKMKCLPLDSHNSLRRFWMQLKSNTQLVTASSMLHMILKKQKNRSQLSLLLDISKDVITLPINHQFQILFPRVLVF